MGLSCLCRGCPDASHKLCSSQPPLPSAIPTGTPDSCWNCQKHDLGLPGGPASWSEPGRSSPHLLFWHISALWREGDTDTAIARRTKNDFLPPVVLMSASPGQDILTGRTPRCHLLCHWDNIKEPLPLGSAAFFFFLPQHFLVVLFCFFISVSQKPWRRGRDEWSYCGNGVQWSSCTALFYTLTLIMHTVPSAHTISPDFSSLCFISPFYSTSPCLHSTPSHPRTSYWSDSSILEKPEAFMSDLRWDTSSPGMSCVTSHFSASVSSL